MRDERKKKKGHSIQLKTILLMSSAIIATMVIATLFGVYSIIYVSKMNSDQRLSLLCRNG